MAFVVLIAANQRGVSVGGERHAEAEFAFSALPAARELFTLLDEWVDVEWIARTLRVDSQKQAIGVHLKPAVKCRPLASVIANPP